MIKKFQQFSSDVKYEMGKVSWPDWNDLKGSSYVVLVFSLILTLYLFLVDFLLSKSISIIMQGFMDWYTLRVISGKEKKIKESILFELDTANLSECVENILVPTENVLEMRDGKKKIKEKVFFPGYLLILLEMNKAVGMYEDEIKQFMLLKGMGMNTLGGI